MKIKVIVLVMVFMLSNCKSQEKIKTNYNKKQAMEIFDINKYKGLKKNPDLHFTENDKSYIDKNKIIRIIDDTKTIQVDVTDKDTSNKSTKVYFKDSNKLYSHINRFYSIAIGLSEEYNEQGKLIKQINWDKDYPFSIDDLISKMNLEYKMSINNVHKTFDVNRYIIKTKPFYEVYYKDDKNNQMLHCFLIDGKNGHILFNSIWYVDQKNGSLYDQYLNSLK